MNAGHLREEHAVRILLAAAVESGLDESSSTEQLPDGTVPANTEEIAASGAYRSVPTGGVIVEINVGGSNENAPDTKTRAAPAVSVAPGGTAEASGEVGGGE